MSETRLYGYTYWYCNKPVGTSEVLDRCMFCDEACLNSYVCEQTAESKDEMLQALSYAENREDLA